MIMKEDILKKTKEIEGTSEGFRCRRFLNFA